MKFNANVEKLALRNRLNSGELLTQEDLEKAEKVARQSPSPDSLSLYSQIKRSINKGDVEQ